MQISGFDFSHLVIKNAPKKRPKHNSPSGFSLVPFDLDGPNEMHFDAKNLEGWRFSKSWGCNFLMPFKVGPLLVRSWEPYIYSDQL